MSGRVSIRTLLLFGTYAVLSSACADVSTAPRAPLTPGVPSRFASAATRTHSEFSGSLNADIFLSCIGEVTHWEGSFTISVDVVQTPTGIVSTRIKGVSDVSTFSVTRADGTRYYMIGQGSTQMHDFEGPVSIVTISEPKVFKSASGDVLVTNYAFVIVFDKNGVPVTVHAVGACP